VNGSKRKGVQAHNGKGQKAREIGLQQADGEARSSRKRKTDQKTALKQKIASNRPEKGREKVNEAKQTKHTNLGGGKDAVIKKEKTRGVYG